MRRTLRRNQAVIRPPSSRTRLSSPRSHVICSPRFHIKSSLSKRRTPLQLGLLSPLHWYSTSLRPLQEEHRTMHIWTNWNRPMSTAISLFERFHCGRRYCGIHTTNWHVVSISFRYFDTSCHKDMAFLCTFLIRP